MRPLGAIAAAWGAIGVASLLIRAIWRLTPIALDGLAGLTATGWLAATAWIGFMAYFEGYRGFQRGFSPRVVARAGELARDPRPLRVVLAPLYCMSLFSAERSRMIVSWLLLAMIVALIAGVSQLRQPYRGIIDAGVVVGLSWGLVALVASAAARLARRRS